MILILFDRINGHGKEGGIQAALQVVLFFTLMGAVSALFLHHALMLLEVEEGGGGDYEHSDLHYRILEENGTLVAIGAMCALCISAVYLLLLTRKFCWRLNRRKRWQRRLGAVCDLTGEVVASTMEQRPHVCKSCSCVCSPSMFFYKYFFLISSSSSTASQPRTALAAAQPIGSLARFGTASSPSATARAAALAALVEETANEPGFNRCPFCCLKAFCFNVILVGFPALIAAASLFAAGSGLYVLERKYFTKGIPHGMVYWFIVTILLDVAALGSCYIFAMPLFYAPVTWFLCIKAMVLKLTCRTNRKIAQSLEKIQYSVHPSSDPKEEGNDDENVDSDRSHEWSDTHESTPLVRYS